MSRYVSNADRKKIAERANYICEYCRLPELFVMLKFQIEHIISLQHGGKSILSNLAYSCPICNSNKGPNIGTIVENEEDFVQFYHPRKHLWHEHFDVRNGLILPKTKIGAGTIKILNFNYFERVVERKMLIEAGMFPNL